MDYAKIKGSHTAMKSGMLAAEAAAEALFAGSEGGNELTGYVDKFKASWLYDALYRRRNFCLFLHRFVALIGGAVTTL